MLLELTLTIETFFALVKSLAEHSEYLLTLRERANQRSYCLCCEMIERCVRI